MRERGRETCTIAGGTKPQLSYADLARRRCGAEEAQNRPKMENTGLTYACAIMRIQLLGLTEIRAIVLVSRKHENRDIQDDREELILLPEASDSLLKKSSKGDEME